MTDDSSTPITKTAHHYDDPENNDVKHQHQKKRSPWLLVFLAVGTLGALGIAGASLWQIQQVQANGKAESTALQEHLMQLQEKNARLETQLNKLKESQINFAQKNRKSLERAVSDWNSEAHTLKEQLKSLENQQQQRIRLNYNKSAENEILEALAVAFRKLNFEQDVPGTIALLELVIDNHCQPPKKAALLPVCSGLETDRSSLTQLPQPNIDRILFEIGGIQKHLLALQHDIHAPNKTQNSTEIEKHNTQRFSELKTWSERFDYALGQLGAFFQKHFVRVHTLSQSDTQRLTLDQRAFLAQNTILLLEQSKSAALRKDQGLFALTLNQARNAYTQYLSQEPDSRNHIALLENLSHIELAPPLPKLVATYAALSALSQSPAEQAPQADQSATPMPAQE